MSPLERESRGFALHEQSRAAGRIRVAQPGAVLAKRKGFESVMAQKRIMSHNMRKADELGINTGAREEKAHY